MGSSGLSVGPKPGLKHQSNILSEGKASDKF